MQGYWQNAINSPFCFSQLELVYFKIFLYSISCILYLETLIYFTVFMKKRLRNYPKLKFIISQKQELKTYLGFLKTGKFVENQKDMNLAFYRPHPKLNILKNKALNDKVKKEIVTDYIKKFYQKHHLEIKKGAERIKRNWQKIAPKFYELTDKIFKNNSWPRGRYIAYSTIWGIYPRFLKSKIFLFPYKHPKKNYAMVVIAHEMLHFMFYGYVYENCPKYGKEKYQEKLWEVSEVLNIIIQNSPEWVKIFGVKCIEYPGLKKLRKKAQRTWKKKQDICLLIKEIIGS